MFIDVLQHDCKVAFGLGNYRPALDGPGSPGMLRQVLPSTSTAAPEATAEPAILL